MKPCVSLTGYGIIEGDSRGYNMPFKTRHIIATKFLPITCIVELNKYSLVVSRIYDDTLMHGITRNDLNHMNLRNYVNVNNAFPDEEVDAMLRKLYREKIGDE